MSVEQLLEAPGDPAQLRDVGLVAERGEAREVRERDRHVARTGHVALQPGDRLVLDDVEQVQPHHRSGQPRQHRQHRLGEVRHSQRDVGLGVARLRERAREHLDDRLGEPARGLAEDAPEQVQVVLGQAGLHHRQQGLEVLDLVVVVDRLVGLGHRQPDRAVVALDEAGREVRRRLALAHRVRAPAREQALDRQQRQAPGGRRLLHLLDRGAVRAQPLEQLQPRGALLAVEPLEEAVELAHPGRWQTASRFTPSAVRT